MFGKNKERGDDDDDVRDFAAPQATAAARGQSPSSSTSHTRLTPDRVREAIRRPTIDTLRRPSVRIRRQASSSSVNQLPATSDGALQDIPEETSGGRRRSSSDPQRSSWHARPGTADRMNPMSTVDENSTSDGLHHTPSQTRGRKSDLRAPRNIMDQLAPHLAPHLDSNDPDIAAQLAAHVAPHTEALEPSRSRNIFSRIGSTARSRVGKGSDAGSIKLGDDEGEYDTDMVDLLDVIDPEVSTLSTLTNVQNSLFVPNLGRFINRRPTYNVSRRSGLSSRQPTYEGRPPSQPLAEEGGLPISKQSSSTGSTVRPQFTHRSTISSTLSESRYAVLPHGESLAGWTPEEKAELNDMVRHMLHSRRAAFKRSMRGFGQYVRRPLGFFITLYAVLITLFGAAWVLFLIGWIGLGSKKDYIVNIVDNVLVALFAIMGDGLAPFRAVDTYHMIYIAHYHHLSWRLRRQKGLPKLQNRNDLPAERNDDEVDLERAAVGPDSEERREHRGEWEYSVLSPEQQRKLQHHQAKFASSHTFYKPHETETHFAFPLRLLVTIVVLLDFHSIFQIALGTCTWAISYHNRPFALTTVILCCSLTCNITGGIMISIGDKRTRKKEVIERMFRQEVTHDAMREVRKRRQKQFEEAQESDAEVLPVHVPPPVRSKKDLEKENAEKEGLSKTTDGLTSHKSKNRWSAIPRLPYLVRKEQEEFDRREQEQLAREAAQEKAEAAGGRI